MRNMNDEFERHNLNDSADSLIKGQIYKRSSSTLEDGKYVLLKGDQSLRNITLFV